MKRDEIENLISPVIAALGLECLGVEYAPQGSGSLLRVYIDAGDRAVGIEDCEAASREISATLDVNDPISGRYTLEVSSPGIDRPLFKPAHYIRFVGAQVKLETHLPIGGRRRFKGELRQADEQGFSVEQDGTEVRLAYDNVARARLVVDLPIVAVRPSKPKPVPQAKPASKKNRSK